jgi:hypothetical protein
MNHPPSCAGRIYGCSHCGEGQMTINESFAHNCAQRPRPTADTIAGALAATTPKYFGAAVRVVADVDGVFLLHYPSYPERAKDNRARNSIDTQLGRAGFRLRHSHKGTEVY